MVFRMDQLLHGLSLGLDAVESEIVGSTSNHGKRVAVLTTAMGMSLGFDDSRLISTAACGLLHDNALTESLAENRAGGVAELLAPHCAKGERNAAYLPFPTETADIIRYHHEYMDASGPFKKRADQTPIGAQLIALADHFDVTYKIKERPLSALDELRGIVKKGRGSYYTELAADAMLACLDRELLVSLGDENIDRSYGLSIPVWSVDADASVMIRLAGLVAAITDYKSKFTAKHSAQIASRAHWMAGFYGYDGETRAKIYFAAALHDLGKLVTPVDILEKPGKLDAGEFEIIKHHVYGSYLMLKDVGGLGEICRWAVTHHRKLNGSGYPELPAEYLEMDFVSRLMACIDIYQAVREARPYHPGRTHGETMEIMWEMADNGEIDRQITADLDSEMSQFPGEGDVPPPVAAVMQNA